MLHLRRMQRINSIMQIPMLRRTAAALFTFVLATACSPQATSAATGSGQTAALAAANAPPAQLSAGQPSAGQASTSTPGPRMLPDFATLVERFGPAVVNVAVVGHAEPTTNVPGLSQDDPLNDFFRRFGLPQQLPRGNQPPPRGEGSGFIISSDGYIMTNAHVVDGASQVTVKLTDRHEYSAKVIGSDRRADIAVLKIDVKGLPTVKIGNPSKLRPGEWVIAIGSPFGFDNSVTAGIVSAKARSLPGEDGNYVPFIQTDVPVNPGNSGGPLFNLDGEVVGINSQIFSRTGGYMGLSFAIPIDIAVGIKDQLINGGKVHRGRIGIGIQEVNAQFADSFGIDRPRGALIGSVESGGPADKAGVKPGDIILKVNGQLLERSSELPVIIAAIKPGSEAQLEIWRDRKSQKVSVRVVELAERSERVANNGDGGNDGAQLGLAVRSLTPEERQEAKTDGLLVERAAGPAVAAGVQTGDIIVGVNGTRVKAVKDLQDTAKRAGKIVALLIQRDGAQIFVPVRIN